MTGVEAALEILIGIGQLVIILVIAFILYRISKFIDAFSEVIRREK